MLYGKMQQQNRHRIKTIVMFDCKQDIGLLHGSLLSTSNSKSESPFDHYDIKDAVNIVSLSVKNIIHYNLNGIKDEKEALKRQLQINERLHAAVFFTTLRCHGIKSCAADTFYNSIVYSWPSVDFRFYVELNFKCDWSEYFIKCAAQLPPEILYKVLKIISDINISNHIKCYSWHLILQTLILKLLEVPYDSENHCPFDFDFTAEKDSSVKDQTDNKVTENCDKISNVDSSHNMSDAISLLKEMFINLSNCVSVRIKETNEEDSIKILFHAVKTLLKSLIAEKERDFKNISRFVDFLNIYHLLRDYFLIDVNIGALKAALQNCSCTVVYHAYATTSWNICLNYLTFLLDYYSNIVCSDLYFQLADHNKLVYADMTSATFYYVIKNLDSPFLHISSPQLDQRLEMLYKIMQLDFQGSSFAAEIILQSDPALVERRDTIMVLTENSHAINFVHHYQLLINSIKAIKSQESKKKLLEVLYKLLLEIDIQMYDKVLGYILSSIGLTKEFQLPDFDDKFSQFTRKTPTLEEAEKILPALFVQNPLTVLKYLIDQTLVQGSEGKVFIQLLRHFPQACSYSQKIDMTILCDVLNQYFEKMKLEAYESKNMVTLYKFLVEVQVEIPILNPDSFLRCCIIPKLQPDYKRIYLILECVHVLVPSLLGSENTLESETVTSLICSLGKIIAHCIKTGNGNLKSFVTPVLKELEIFQEEKKQISEEEKEVLWSFKFKYMEEMVNVYVKEFLPKNIDFSSKSFIWTWCCKKENSNLFEENFSCETLTYPVLLKTLVEVLPHFTKEEWLYSVQLMKICCKNQDLRKEILHSFTNLFNLSEAELDTYAVISCIITSLHFILNDIVCDPLYISTCFSNCLINLVNQEETVHTHMLITIFLDMCYLVSCVSPNLIQIFTAMLLELKKQIIDSCSVKCHENDYKILISDAIACLPNSSEKDILFQKLNK